MAAGESTYRRLPGRSRRGASLWFAESNQLYLADDHLVHVYKSNRYNETYKRFEYGDIQAIIVRKTSTALYINTAMYLMTAAILLAAVAIGINNGFGSGLDIVFYVIGGLAGLAAVFQHAQGATCTTSLVTPVQVEELPSLGRWRAARKAVSLISDRIHGAQAGADPADPPVEALRGRVRAWLAARTANLRHDTGNLHLLLFGFVLFDAGLCAVNMVWPFSVPQPVSVIVALLWLILIVAALVQQNRSDLPPALKTITAAYAVVAFGILAVAMGVGSVLMTDANAPDDLGVRYIFQLINGVNMVADVAVAVPGILMVRQHQAIGVPGARPDAGEPGGTDSAGAGEEA